LILDGGAFNGSYLIGALLFLKEMEKRNYICVDKISGCSVGSAIGLLYFLDKLDLCYLLNGISVNSIRTTGKLEFIKDFKTYIFNSYQSEKEETNMDSVKEWLVPLEEKFWLHVERVVVKN
jgi:predicted acylesterase/phospholipase RssA